MRGTIESILVIIVARIGDTLLTTPVFKAIKSRYPNAQLTVLAHPKRMEVLSNLVYIDRLDSITKRSAPWRGWFSRKKFDLAIVFGAEPKLISYAQRTSTKVAAFRREGMTENPRLLKVALPHGAIHAVRERLLLTTALDIQANDLKLDYIVSPEEKAVARKWLDEHGIATAHPLIGLQTLSFPTKSHRNWPLNHFSELIQLAIEKYPTARFVILGDEASRIHAKGLAEHFPVAVSIAAGTMSLRHSAALMSCLDMYVGVDTGPTHIAGALGIPMVSMYHCAYPGRYLAPLDNPLCAVIEHPLTGTTVDIAASMADIPVASVWNALDTLLCSTADIDDPRTHT